MSALEYCAVSTGNLAAGSNDTLTKVDGLSSLTFIGGMVHIMDNAALCEADALALVAGWWVEMMQVIENNTGTCP